jgi:hypothetical protein
LQDLLHAAGEEGITQSDYGDQGGDVMQARVEPFKAMPVADYFVLNITDEKGLPACTSKTARKYIFLALKLALRKRVLCWEPPIYCGTQMKIAMEDKQQDKYDDRRFSKVTLRAQPYFQGRPARDNVKMIIEDDEHFQNILRILRCDVHYTCILECTF